MTKRSQAPPPLPVVAGLFVVTLFSFGLAVVPRVKQLAWLGAGFNLAFGALMTAYVFGADTYTNDGRSRWATRSGIRCPTDRFGTG